MADYQHHRHHHYEQQNEGEDIEYCGTGWYSVLEGSNLICESGSCCSIHGKCGQQSYHCEYGLHPYWVLFTGIIQMSIWSFIYQTQVTFPRLLKLMENYKRTGLRVDAIIVGNQQSQNDDKQRRWCWYGISRLFRCYQEGMRHCRWNRLIIEYNVKTTTTASKGGNNNNNKSLLKRGNPRENESYYRVRKTIYVSNYVLKNIIGGTDDDNNNNNDNNDGIIRILVLPSKPKSGFPRDEIILTTIKQQNQLKATYVAILIFTCLYLYLSILVVSLIGGHKSKLLGWQYFICNFIWTPIIPFIVGKIRDAKESKRWLYDDGEYIFHDHHHQNSSNSNRTTTTNQQQQHKPLLMFEEGVDEEDNEDDDEEER